VLQTLVESAARLCDADKGTITRQIDGVFYRAESYGFPAEVMERWRNVAVTLERGSAAGRALLEGCTVHIPDAGADSDYTFDTAGAVIRSMLGVPMQGYQSLDFSTSSRCCKRWSNRRHVCATPTRARLPGRSMACSTAGLR
ncbi:MAG: GAF domain-containing protein, partial [Xanthobacteraceae bacterium]